MAAKQIIIVCGEASGDLNAAGLAKAIKETSPETRILAVGGRQLAAAGAEIFYDIKGLSVMGLFDVFKKLPLFFSLKKLILKKVREEKPDALILVDFSGFNLRLAKAINKSLPVIYYVSPQVWASRPGRVRTIKKYIHKMVVLFSFEEEFYRKHGVEVEFAGHPLLDIVRPSMEKNAFLANLSLSAAKTTIALLPGSREAEIKNVLPAMLKSAEIIAGKIKDAQFIIAKSAQVELDTYEIITMDFKPDLRIIEDKTYDCLNAADFCLVCSGTATLETAIMQKPLAVVYKMNLLNYLLYRPQVKVPYIGMVNIVAGKMIAPEFIQFRAKPAAIASAALKVLSDPAQADKMKKDLGQIKASLGSAGASSRAAKIILNFLNK
ncbi:MAG: lipid-A-disaccharide synthase [Candidatus Omnitrophota bacterium]